MKVDILADEHILLAWAGVDDARRNALAKNVAADLHQFAWMRVRRQPQHHGDAAIAPEPPGEDATAAAVWLVVVLDVVEHERRAGAGSLRHAQNCAELDIPIH